MIIRIDRMNPLFPCDHGATTHSCIMHDPGRSTLCKNAADGRLAVRYGMRHALRYGMRFQFLDHFYCTGNAQLKWFGVKYLFV